jgi:hypothetical protein
MEDKRIDAWIPGDCKDYLMERAKQEDRSMNQLLAELIQQERAREQGAVIEQQSLPVIREIVQSELRKQLAQQRLDLREDMHLEFVNEIKTLLRASDNRIAAFLVKIFRHANIGQRLIYTVLARAHGSDYAAKVYEDASQKAGRDLRTPLPREDTAS